jgi:hypothetical protein
LKIFEVETEDGGYKIEVANDTGKCEFVVSGVQLLMLADWIAVNVPQPVEPELQVERVVSATEKLNIRLHAAEEKIRRLQKSNDILEGWLHALESTVIGIKGELIGMRCGTVYGVNTKIDS